MKKQLLILSVILICRSSVGQLLYPSSNSQIKGIADYLVKIENYQAVCDFSSPLRYGDILKITSRISTLRVPNDTLCGFYYCVKSPQDITSNEEVFAYFKEAVHNSINGSLHTTRLMDEPDRFKRIMVTNGYLPAIHKSSSFYEVTPYLIGNFIYESLNNLNAVINQMHDTLINRTLCSKYIIKDTHYNNLRVTELCFHKEKQYPIYYRQEFLGGYYKIVEFSNTIVNGGLPENFFSSDYLFGDKYKENQESIELQIGAIAPDWELPILGTEKKLSNKSLEGNYVLLEVTGTWCPHCVDAISLMNKIEDEFDEYKNLTILSVFSAEIDTKERIQKFANEKNIKSTILYAAKSVADNYKVIGYPSFFIIAPTGELVMKKAGYSLDIENEIISFLKENAR